MANQVQSSGGIQGGTAGAVTSVSGTANYITSTGGTTPVIDIDSVFKTRVTTLENNVYKVAYFASVNAASGTVTIPTGATILTDQFPGGVDALVSTISSGQPTGSNPVTGGGTLVDVTSFDTGGNFVLTGTPSAFPVAIIYQLSISAANWANLTIGNILEYAPLNMVQTVSGTANRITIAGTRQNPTVDIASNYVGQNTITTLGTLTTGVTGAGFTIALGTSTITGILLGVNGGTGVANTGFTITLAGNLATTGAFNTTFAASATGTYTLPSATSTLLANALGISGGSTLIGGTAVGDGLTIYGTSGNGTLTAASIIFKGGNSGATELGRALNNGTLLWGSTTNAGVSLVLFQKNQNTGTYISVINTTSNTAAYAGNFVSTTDALSSAVGTVAYSAGYTTSGMFVANSGAIFCSMSAGLNIGTNGAAPTSLWTNNTLRSTISSAGLVTWSAAYHVFAAGTATAAQAATKFTPGIVLSTPEAGAFESDANSLLYTTAKGGTRGTLSRTLFTATADATVTNTTSDTSAIPSGVGTVTVKNNDLIVGRIIRVYIGGVYSTPAVTGGTATIKVTIGATVVATVATTALLTNASGLRFEGWVDITVRSIGASGSVVCCGAISYAIGLAGQIAADSLDNGGAATTVDTTADRAIGLTVAWDTAAVTKIVKTTTCSIEFLN